MRGFLLSVILGIAALGTVAVTPASVRAADLSEDGFNDATTVPVRWWGGRWGGYRGWGYGGYRGWGGYRGYGYGGYYRPYYGGYGYGGYYPGYSSLYYGFGYPYSAYYYSSPGLLWW
jgi:hypothetical protein